MKLKPSDIWCACELAKVQYDQRNRIVHTYMVTGELPSNVKKVIRDWPKEEEE